MSPFFAPLETHFYANIIHTATCRKAIIAIAEQNGKGSLKLVKKMEEYTRPNLRSNECLVGVYSEPDESKLGKSYVLSLVGRLDVLWKSLGMRYK